MAKNKLNPVEMAINLSKYKKTLIFTPNRNYIPTFETILSLKETVYLTQSEAFFEIFKTEYDKYDQFIILDGKRRINDFEMKYFELFRRKFKEKIIIFDSEGNFK